MIMFYAIKIEHTTVFVYIQPLTMRQGKDSCA